MMDETVKAAQWEAIEAAAAEWVARLDGGPLDAAERIAFRDWLDAHPDHRPAFDEVHSAWRSLDPLRGRGEDWRRAGPPAAPPARGRAVRRGAAVLGLLAVLALGALGLDSLGFGIRDLAIAWRADHRTLAGERRHLSLPDGSEVELGPDSALALHYSATERRVSLLAGEAYFAARPVSQDESRAFVVEAGGGSTTALGTAFTVNLEDDCAEVVALEHNVRVALSTPKPAAGEEVVLAPGDAVRYGEARGLGRVRRVDVARKTAWRRGVLVFDEESLSDAVATLNRYRTGRILVLGSALKSREVTGVFQASDLGDAIDAIAGELGARRRSLPGGLTVLY
ncbi:FecR domain-containing protein [Ancylobacter sp. 6x-1]|uniref:FecR domain-containing protein n=1 Tax=Ancylobacter crimeensis TaxID=2579147 RepID=A0ABT0DB40_9HYPH|nr:FecR domain-containing protein [Ancylobacter crimeensis]MCK0197173.1 FecR domain-containing protein [Ancylobacter crimeensis]